MDNKWDRAKGYPSVNYNNYSEVYVRRGYKYFIAFLTWTGLVLQIPIEPILKDI